MHLVTLTTRSDYTALNWKNTAAQCGYNNVTILGLEQRWQGWAWRAQQYKEYVDTLPKKDLVLLTDCNDIFFARGPQSVINAYNYYFQSSPRGVLFGGALYARDDQEAHLRAYIKNENYLRVDDETKLVANINQYSIPWFPPNELALLWTWRRELQHWNIVGHRKDVTCIKECHLKNNLTQGAPPVLHFPGRNINAYKHFGVKLYGDAFLTSPQ